MMGLPEGWVTDVDVSRNDQLKMLGNGVVPQQALLALQLLVEQDRLVVAIPNGGRIRHTRDPQARP